MKSIRMEDFTVASATSQICPYFLPFFFRTLPLSVIAGPPPSTKIASSSLVAFAVGNLAGVVEDASNSFINSD